MTQTRKLRSLLVSAAAPALAMLVIAFFGGYALVGPNGVLAWGDYHRTLQKRQVELKKVEAQRAVIANRVALLDPKKANPDMVDELIRKQMGLAHPDEVIIPLD
ncbi:MAG: septum formation initiator [Sphingomonas sp. SCN 67-18]|uniref:FtsB family cell division protein n=1 Tax=uncultured Sphingomonas sp. TaxID=158754 RepID=UPI00086CBD71|nr:septum formation initiator family protein [Sphingomonas sp. SCN 67-18]ODU21489.1 MAG: septum formation initiator [Sphingomonas sp. SCN 67-18]